MNSDYVFRPIPTEALGVGVVARAYLEIDHEAREVFVGSELTPLTKTEFEILVFLSDNPRRVMSRDQIMNAVWADPWNSDDHVLETMISRLRIKLGETAQTPRFIKTIRGIGYRFDPEVVEQQSPPPFVDMYAFL